MATTLVWSERVDPNAPGGAWRDCTYSAGLTALVFGGFTKFPLGIYTVAEREALERSDTQPNETGASLDDLILAVHNRYKIDWHKSGIALLAQHHKRLDLGFILQGSPGNLPAGHPLRIYDPGFTGGHAVFANPTGDGTHVHWFDPEAPNKAAPLTTDWATVMKWIGAFPYYIVVREDDYAPVIVVPPAPPAPVTFTQTQVDALVNPLKAQIATATSTNADLQKALATANTTTTATKAALAIAAAKILAGQKALA
jgi:hypothetical protein